MLTAFRNPLLVGFFNLLFFVHNQSNTPIQSRAAKIVSSPTKNARKSLPDAIRAATHNAPRPKMIIKQITITVIAATLSKFIIN